jgi:hypothetical protein
MSKIWDEREKSLEEEYFRRKEKELIEKLRAKRVQEQHEKAEAATVHCPKCDGTLVPLTYEGVRLDRCVNCNGVWLEAEDLNRLMKQPESHGWLSRMWRSISTADTD